MRLYHPELRRTCEVGTEAQAKVLAESGWSRTIPADYSDPAVAADQPDVVYQPVPVDKPRPVRKSSKETADTD